MQMPALRVALLTSSLLAVPCVAATQEVGRIPGYDGVAIEYEIASQGSPTLVFVHGWMCDRTFWREQIPRFSADYGVVLLDLGGHGRSGSNRSDWTVNSFSHDVSAVIRALDLGSVILVGHSMGGPVIAETALLEPDRVVGVIGVDTYQYLEAGWLAGDGVPNLADRLRNNFPGVTRGLVRSMFTASSDSALARLVTAAMTAGTPSVGVPSTESMFEWYRDAGISALNRIRQPLWTINSAEYVGTDVERLQQQVPRIRVRIMDGVGHFVMLEAPDRFNEHLADLVVAVLKGDG